MAAMMRHLCTPCARACHGPHGCCRPVYPSPLRRAILADCPPLASLIPFSERDGITWHYSNPCGLHCGDACLAAGHSLPGTEWNGMGSNGMEWNGKDGME